MKTKFDNYIKAVCIASFCVSALSQTLVKVAGTAEKADEKSNKYFVCTPIKASIRGYNRNNLNTDDCKNKPIADLCNKFMLDMSQLTPEGGFYVRILKDNSGTSTSVDSWIISRSTGNFSYSHIWKDNDEPGRYNNASESSGECELKTESLKF